MFKALFYILQSRMRVSGYLIECGIEAMSVSTGSVAVELWLDAASQSIELRYKPFPENEKFAGEWVETIPRYFHESFPFLTYKETRFTIPAHATPAWRP
ncbi:MAG: hypothetical protein IPN33_14265 [Saprospiraceae bacterium]|nr:hypothetical protein [Saprospiraceae bacterium]